MEKKMVYIHRTEYFGEIKKLILDTCNSMNEFQNNYADWKKSDPS